MCRKNFKAILMKKVNFFREDMRKFQHIPRSEKWLIFWILLVLAKWDGTLPLCVRHIYNWYLLEAYDLANMLDTFIGVWKCKEKILKPFWWKKSTFFMKIWENSNTTPDPKNDWFFWILLCWRNGMIRYSYPSDTHIIDTYLKLRI